MHEFPLDHIQIISLPDKAPQLPTNETDWAQDEDSLAGRG